MICYKDMLQRIYVSKIKPTQVFVSLKINRTFETFSLQVSSMEQFHLRCLSWTQPSTRSQPSLEGKKAFGLLHVLGSYIRF